MQFRQLVLTSLITLAVVASVRAQDKPRELVAPQLGVEYDARLFLSATERTALRKVYPNFDEPRIEKNWEWKDVDPLGLFSTEENRRRRREAFLFEYSAETRPNEEESTADQQAFEAILRRQFDDPTILMGRNTIKIITPYTELYEGKLPLHNLLEKTARLGLQWAQVGGTQCLIYNGPILMSRYKAGYVSLADGNIDRPARRPVMKQGPAHNLQRAP